MLVMSDRTKKLVDMFKSQSLAAKRLGVTQAQLNRIYNGKSEVPKRMVRTLMEDIGKGGIDFDKAFEFVGE